LSTKKTAFLATF